jgi:hypothetical protein
MAWSEDSALVSQIWAGRICRTAPSLLGSGIDVRFNLGDAMARESTKRGIFPDNLAVDCVAKAIDLPGLTQLWAKGEQGIFALFKEGQRT